MLLLLRVRVRSDFTSSALSPKDLLSPCSSSSSSVLASSFRSTYCPYQSFGVIICDSVTSSHHAIDKADCLRILTSSTSLLSFLHCAPCSVWSFTILRSLQRILSHYLQTLLWDCFHDARRQILHLRQYCRGGETKVYTKDAKRLP